MASRARRSKALGPFRLTVGKRGLGVTVGGKRVRLGRSATGRSGPSVRLPGGLSCRERHR
jgi:hypothetical protein